MDGWTICPGPRPRTASRSSGFRIISIWTITRPLSSGSRKWHPCRGWVQVGTHRRPSAGRQGRHLSPTIALVRHDPSMPVSLPYQRIVIDAYVWKPSRVMILTSITENAALWQDSLSTKTRVHLRSCKAYTPTTEAQLYPYSRNFGSWQILNRSRCLCLVCIGQREIPSGRSRSEVPKAKDATWTTKQHQVRAAKHWHTNMSLMPRDLWQLDYDFGHSRGYWWMLVRIGLAPRGNLQGSRAKLVRTRKEARM